MKMTKNRIQSDILEWHVPEECILSVIKNVLSQFLRGVLCDER